MTFSTSPPPDRCLTCNFLREKGKSGGRCSFAARGKTLYKAGASQPGSVRNPPAGAAARIKRARCAWDFVCGWCGDWPLLRWSSAASLSVPALASVATSGAAVAQSVNAIVVEGNRRVEAETIRSYFSPARAAGSDPPQIDEALKALYAHRPVPGRAHQPCRRPAGRHRGREPGDQPGRLRRQQEGQGRAAQAEVQSKPRGTLSRPTVQADVQRIVEIYRRSGRFDVRVDAEDHRAAEQPRRSGVRDQRRREDRRQGHRLRRQPRLFAMTGCKDVIKTGGEQLAELPADHRHLRSRPHRGRPRPAAPLLSQARLCRRAHRLGGRRIRPGARRASSSPSRSTKAPQYRFGTVDVHVERARDRSGVAAQRGCKLGAGDVYNAEAVEKTRRGHDDRGRQARLCLRQGAPARRPRLPDRTDQPRLHRRGGPARLHRADQYPRQHPHARLRDPPRIRYRRGRRLQPRAGRPRRAAPEEPQLLQDRQDHQRAGLGARPRRRQRRRRGAVDRRVLGLRRLFDRRRLHRRSQRRRAQPARPRPVRQGVGAATASTRAASSCRSPSRICSATGWPAASTCSRKQNAGDELRVLRQRRRSASICGWASR